jgi:hypothetical protein
MEGCSGDPDVKRSLDWFLSLLPEGDWERRKAAIEETLERALLPGDRVDWGRLSILDDRIGWYLYLAETGLYEPLKTEWNQGSRVLPVFKRLGADLDFLLKVDGAEGKARKLLGEERRQADSTLFEMLVATTWASDGWEKVRFIPATPGKKSPDLAAGMVSNEWFIEAKRLSAHSGYSQKERENWIRLWMPLAQELRRQELPLVLDIAFHVELVSLPTSFLVDELAGKLRFVFSKSKIVSSEILDAVAEPVDFDRISRRLRDSSVKALSRQEIELIGGSFHRAKGFSSTVMAKRSRAGDGIGLNLFVEDVSWAAAAYWSCDAKRATQAKARDIRKQLADAVSQLPGSGKCAVHLGLETLDGVAVEEVRYDRIVNTVDRFDSKGKDLRCVFVHLFESYSPPTEAWVFDETLQTFSKVAGRGPLRHPFAVLPRDVDVVAGSHWERPAP